MLHKGVLVMAGVKLNIGDKTVSIDYEKIGGNKLLLQRIFDAIKHMFSTKDHKKVKEHCKTLKLKNDPLDKIKAYEALKVMSGIHGQDYKVMLKDNKLILSIAGKDNQKIEARISLTDNQEKILSMYDNDNLTVAFKQLDDFNTKLDNFKKELEIQKTKTSSLNVSSQREDVVKSFNSLKQLVKNPKDQERFTIDVNWESLNAQFKIQINSNDTKTYDMSLIDLNSNERKMFAQHLPDVLKSSPKMPESSRNMLKSTLDTLKSLPAEEVTKTIMSMPEGGINSNIGDVIKSQSAVYKASSPSVSFDDKEETPKSLSDEKPEETLMPESEPRSDAASEDDIDRYFEDALSQSTDNKTSSLSVDDKKSRTEQSRQFLNDTSKEKSNIPSTKDKKGKQNVQERNHLTIIDRLKLPKKKIELYEIILKKDNPPLEQIKAYKKLRAMGKDKNKYKVWLQDGKLILSKTRKNETEFNTPITLTWNEKELLPMYDNSKLLDAFEQMHNIRTKIADLEYEINKQQTEETSDSKIASLRDDIIKSFNNLKNLTKGRKDQKKFNLKTDVKNNFAELSVNVTKTNIVRFTMNLSGINTGAEAKSFRKKSGLDQSEDL